MLGALSHQDVPFERLVDELALPRDPLRPPLLRVVFQLQSTGRTGGEEKAGLELPGLTLAPFSEGAEAAKFDLVVHLFEAAGRVAGVFRYDADLFDPATVERLAGSLTTLLDAWTLDPARRLADLPLLAAAERHQLLVEWNPAVYPAAAPLPLHRRFEARADRAPEAVALSLPGAKTDRRMTYGELDARADRLARRLRALRRAAGGPRRPPAGALGGDGGGDPRRAQDRRRLRAGRSRLSGRADRLHPGGQRRLAGAAGGGPGGDRRQGRRSRTPAAWRAAWKSASIRSCRPT